MRTPSPYPRFNYSYSRANALSRCERQYFHQYYGSHGGWSPTAPDTTRVAYALKQMTSVPSLLGTTIHDLALQCIARIMAGMQLPSVDEMVDSARRRLRNTYVTSKRNRDSHLRRASGGGVMLQEVFYDGFLTRERVERARRVIETCVGNLHASDLWSTIRDADPRDVIVIPPGAFPSFDVDGVQVYALPDVVYRPDPEAAWHIRDWKTGTEPNGGVIDQIALQALYVHRHLRLPAVGGVYVGEIANLRHGTVEAFSLDESDLDEARQAVARDTARMHAMLEDPHVNAPKDMSMFEPTEHASRCVACNFRQLCLGIASPAVDTDQHTL